MGDDERPRQFDLQRKFFEQWYEDMQEGITLRSTYNMIREHLPEDEAFQRATVERLAALETGAERDAEERTFNGRGRTHPTIPQASPIPREARNSKPPWWSKDPWKGLISKALLPIIMLIVGYMLRHLGLKP